MILKRILEYKILNLDYLVYSSHKTSTQSLSFTLRNNGFKCKHCHNLKHIGLKSGSFLDYLKRYSKKNNKKLDVITVFREPLERHMSSFFQGYGTRPLQVKEVKDKSETIIYKKSIHDLQEIFVSELSSQTLIGYRDSIHEICNELNVSVGDLNSMQKEEQYNLYETEYIKLYLFRFEVLINNFERLLSEISNKKLKIEQANTSDLKWYKDIYSDFKSTIKIPSNIISQTYESKKDIINLLYHEGYQAVLNNAINRFGQV